MRKVVLFGTNRGGGSPPSDDRFIITVKTDNAGTSASNQFTIPTNTSGITQAFLYDIETSDGQTITGLTGNHTITFPSAGEYDIKISGSFPYIYFNSGGDRQKLLDIKNFGIYALGSTSQNRAFYKCNNLVISANDSGNFGNVTIFTNFFNQCESLTSFPLLDFSSGTNFAQAWVNCYSLASFPANAFDTNIATNYSAAFQSTNLTTQSIDDILVSLDASGVSNGTFTQSGGQGRSYNSNAAVSNLIAKGWTLTLTTPVASPEFVFTVKTDNAGTSASNQFTIPTSTTGITEAFLYDIETSDGQTITGVTGDTTITFPSAGTYDIFISGSFPYMYFNNGGDKLKLLDIKNFGIYALGATSQLSAFTGCSNIVISATDIGHFGSVTNFTSAWNDCSSLTLFPLIDTSSATNFTQTWRNCSSLTSFPLIDTSSGITVAQSWSGCTSLTSFPLIDTSNVTNFDKTWQSCTNLTSFPLIDTSNGTNFNTCWSQCNNLVSMPAIDLSNAINITTTWQSCSSLTTFNSNDLSSIVNTFGSFRSTSLQNFPANVFDACTATNFSTMFNNTNLTTQSIDNILVSLDTAGQSNGTFAQSGGQAPSATGEAAIDSLVGKGWTITVTGGYTP
jgi:hypothetical protein